MTRGQQLAAFLLDEANFHSATEKQALQQPRPSMKRFKPRQPVRQLGQKQRPKGYNFLMVP